MFNILFGKITANVLGLCEVADLEAQMLNLAQMYIEIPNVDFKHGSRHFAKPLLAAVIFVQVDLCSIQSLCLFVLLSYC